MHHILHGLAQAKPSAKPHTGGTLGGIMNESICTQLC